MRKLGKKRTDEDEPGLFIPRKKKPFYDQVIAPIVSKFITICFLPVFCLASFLFAYLFKGEQYSYGDLNLMWVLIFLAFLLLLSSFVHELGHATAALSYGNTVVGFGIYLGWMGLTFYTQTEDDFQEGRNVSKKQMAHILLSGVEAELLFSGFVVMLASIIDLSLALYFFEITILGVAWNLYPAFTSDGNELLNLFYPNFPVCIKKVIQLFYFLSIAGAIVMYIWTNNISTSILFFLPLMAGAVSTVVFTGIGLVKNRRNEMKGNPM